MNITTAFPNYPVSAVPVADSMRRDNRERELVNPPAAAESSPQEAGIGREGNRPQADFSFEPKSTSESSTDDQVNGQSEDETSEESAEEQRGRTSGDQEQSPEAEREEQEKVQELQARDREVRTHEQQHAAVGGQYAGSPSYSFERGPDGKSYAVEGEVKIDVSPVQGDPAATIQKMDVVRRAALAPAQPSSADRSVAAKASSQAAQARAELVQEQTATANGAGSGAANETDGAKEGANQANSAGSQQIPADVKARGERVEAFYANAVQPRAATLALTA